MRREGNTRSHSARPRKSTSQISQMEATAEVLDAEGWFHTGDLAQVTEEEMCIRDRSWYQWTPLQHTS